MRLCFCRAINEPKRRKMPGFSYVEVEAGAMIEKRLEIQRSF